MSGFPVGIQHGYGVGFVGGGAVALEGRLKVTRQTRWHLGGREEESEYDTPCLPPYIFSKFVQGKTEK